LVVLAREVNESHFVHICNEVVVRYIRCDSKSAVEVTF